MPELESIYAVYTPGKVATTTTHDALQSAINEPVFNIRVGTPEGIATYVRTFQERFGQPLPTDEAAFDAARKDNPLARLKLVTLTREPVAAAVSNWFYGFHRNHPGEDPNDWTVDEHREAIVDGGYAHRPDYFTGWLGFECGALTGIDVYDTPFSPEQGYQTYTSDKADLLIIRAESLDRVFHEAFRSFGGIEVEALRDKNVGDTSTYGPIYRDFKANPQLPAEFIAAQHDTPFARNFYTPGELAIAGAKWTASA